MEHRHSWLMLSDPLIFYKVVRFFPPGTCTDVHHMMRIDPPPVLKPCSTVMSRMDMCMLCDKSGVKCREVYVQHCWGWITCEDCMWRALLGRMHQQQNVHAALDPSIVKHLPSNEEVRFYRKRIGGVQVGYLNPVWHQVGKFIHVDGLQLHLSCVFENNGSLPEEPHSCLMERFVSVANLVFHNDRVTMGRLLGDICQRLRHSELYEMSVRKKWCRAVYLNLCTGLEFHVAEPALREHLREDLVCEVKGWFEVFAT